MSPTALRIALAFALFLSVLGLAPKAAANGILLTGAGGSEPSRGTAASPVSLQEHRVTAKLNDQVAEVTVEQTFFNHSRDQLEGTYLFPLPEGAVVSEFAMTMMGKMVQGEVVEAKKARRIYEGIVRRRRDPGLLEYVGRGLFRARVFPIEAQKPLTIKLTFQQVLLDDMGTLELRYPLATDRMNGTPVQRVLLDFELQSSVDLKAIYSPSHEIEVVRDGERKARVTYESARRRQTRDLLLYVGRSADTIGLSVLSAKAAGEDGTFMAVLAPPQAASDAQRVAKDVVFVLDTSGSMAGEKIEQARRALVYGVRTLGDGDRFNVMSFSTSVRPFRDGLVAATREVREAAASWIAELGASGGTNIEDALRTALSSKRADRRLDVVFITDGRPTVGSRDTASLVRIAAPGEGPQARVYTFGVGYDLDVTLLDRIADATHGTRDYVAPEEDLEVVTSRFFRKVQQPVFTNVAVDLGPGVYDVYPREVGDLFAGTQVVLFGRYREPATRPVSISGVLGAERAAISTQASFVESGGPDYLQRLWANRKVAYLLDEIRLRGSNKELVDEVVKLATRHAIVTPYTSGLVVEESEILSEDPVIRDEEIADHVETDNDLPFEEHFGQGEGLRDVPFEGPANNGTVGVGGGAGSAFRGRGGSRGLATGGGGRKKFDDAVDDALRWLAAHQSPNGGWEAAGFDRWCNGQPYASTSDGSDRGSPTLDVGLTGLTLSSFLAAGYTNRGRHPFAKVVSRGLRYLKNVQDPEGAFGQRNLATHLLQHAWATLAMVEAYGMTGSPIFKGSALRALAYALAHRSADGSWGAGEHVRETTLWMSLVLRSAAAINADAVRRGRAAPLPSARAAAKALVAWAEAQRPATAAEGAPLLLARSLLGPAKPSGAGWRQLVDLVGQGAPAGTAGIDAATYHHAAYAMWRVFDGRWDGWKKAQEAVIVASQHKGAGAYCDRKGSWDPRGPFAAAGGRVYMTAMFSRSLEVFYAIGHEPFDELARAAANPARPAVDFGRLSEKQKAEQSEKLRDLKESSTADAAGRQGRVRTVAGRRFERSVDGVWTDAAFDGSKEPTKIESMSQAWFDLARRGADVARMLALGDRMILVVDGQPYEIVPRSPDAKEEAPK